MKDSKEKGGERIAQPVTAVYPGTFDPPTNGHLDVIERGARLFSHLIVGVANNPEKGPLFSVEERLTMLRRLTAGFANVEIAAFSGLTVEFCRKRGAKVILRGIRTFSDFEYEFQMALTNRSLASEIETLFVMPSETYSYLSSSMVKEAVALGGDLSRFVPETVLDCLVRKYGRMRPTASDGRADVRPE